jgi:ferredoxin
MQNDIHPTLRIEPQGWRVPLPGRHALARRRAGAGIVLPRSCRNGSCRTCRCRLLAGEVRYRVEWPGLLAEEKAEGWILPCVALADADVVIEADSARPA